MLLYVECQTTYFPLPISIICNYYIHKSDLADLSSFWGEKWNKFPVFSLTGIFLTIFPVFPVPWVPWSVYHLIGPRNRPHTSHHTIKVLFELHDDM